MKITFGTKEWLKAYYDSLVMEMLLKLQVMRNTALVEPIWISCTETKEYKHSRISLISNTIKLSDMWGFQREAKNVISRIRLQIKNDLASQKG